MSERKTARRVPLWDRVSGARTEALNVAAADLMPGLRTTLPALHVSAVVLGDEGPSFVIEDRNDPTTMRTLVIPPDTTPSEVVALCDAVINSASAPFN